MSQKLMANIVDGKNAELAELREALAASQRRETDLQAEIRRMDAYKAELHALNDQLQARLDAAEWEINEWWEQVDSRWHAAQEVDAQIAGARKELFPALSPTDTPAGDTK